MFARCSAALRAVGSPASRRSLALPSLSPQQPGLQKRGRPRLYDGLAQAQHPDNIPLVKLLQQCGSSSATNVKVHKTQYFG